MTDCLQISLEEHIDDLPTPHKRICPINRCVMQTGPLGAVHPRIYDGMLYWICPVCAGTWHRWPPGHPLRVRAGCFVDPVPGHLSRLRELE